MFKIRNWIILIALGVSVIMVLGSGMNYQDIYNKASNELVQDFRKGLEKIDKIHISFKQ